MTSRFLVDFLLPPLVTRRHKRSDSLKYDVTRLPTRDVPE